MGSGLAEAHLGVCWETWRQHVLSLVGNLISCKYN